MLIAFVRAFRTPDLRRKLLFTLGIISNLMNLLGVKSFYQELVKGSVIILAVLLVARGRKS